MPAAVARRTPARVLPGLGTRPELGWRLDSPADVTLTPLPQIEIDPGGGEGVHAAAQAVGRAEVWMRENTALAMNRPPWLHLY